MIYFILLLIICSVDAMAVSLIMQHIHRNILTYHSLSAWAWAISWIILSLAFIIMGSTYLRQHYKNVQKTHKHL